MITKTVVPRLHTERMRIAPSVLAANFASLPKQIEEVEKTPIDRLHVDIMDGHFVPNISFGSPIIRALRDLTELPLEIHLMIEDPDVYLQNFAEEGADSFLVHWEGNHHLHRTILKVKALGKRVGVALNPATPASFLEELLPELDVVLVMTVNPGCGHQAFIHSMLPKVSRVREMIDRLSPGCDLEVDGGINTITAPLVVAAGANVLIAGTSVFGVEEGITAGVKRLHSSVGEDGSSAV